MGMWLSPRGAGQAPTRESGPADLRAAAIRSAWQDPSIAGNRGLAFWVVSDNIRKGAATNAVEIAELLVANDWLSTASRRAMPASVGVGAGGPA